MRTTEGSDPTTSPQEKAVPHICVCICTYKRPEPLKRLLSELNRQQTGNMFTYSIVVADNDAAMSAEATVAELSPASPVPLKYYSQPKRGIALTRNKVLENAEGDYLALIDDDEFPIPEWLLTLLKVCQDYQVDGVLGPVIRHFDEVPPAWLEKSDFYVRPVRSTGMRVDWNESRTSNVLLSRKVILGDPAPFRAEFRAGEDQDFFRRKSEDGNEFIWSAEAIVYEVIPPARWKRSYLLKRALLQGACETLLPRCRAASIGKSILAVPLYTAALPVMLLFGQRHFMTLLEKLFYHAGKLLMSIGINPIREEYISD